MAAGLDQRPSASMRLQDRITSAKGLELLSRALSAAVQPIYLAIIVPPLLGAHASGLAGALWGVVPALTAGVIPYVDARRLPPSAGGKSFRQVGRAFASILGGLAITGVAVAMGAAPLAVLAVATALLAVLVVIAPITAWRRWDVSIHASTAAGCAVVCYLEFGSHPGLGAGLGLLAAAVAWSRVHQRHHTVAESVAGLMAGGVTCWLVYGALI